MDDRAGKKKKRWILPVVLILAVLCAAAFFVLRRAGLFSGGDAESDGDVFGFDEDGYYDEGIYTPQNSRFNGVIEPQETWEIQKDSDRKVGLRFVEVGDEVEEGSWLFAYDTADIAIQIQQLELEMDSIQNDITGQENQIRDLTAQRAQVSADQQLGYTLQIQELSAGQRQSELNLRIKQVELDNLNSTKDNAIVVSKMAGVVRQITENPTDGQTAYMTILATGNYQAKCTVDETNIWQLSEGMPVLLHSRVEKDRTWNGTIRKIDTENTVSNNNNNSFYYDGSNSDMQATKYYFYADLEETDGLLLGQHVYVEPLTDQGVYMDPDANEASGGEGAAAEGEEPSDESGGADAGELPENKGVAEDFSWLEGLDGSAESSTPAE